MTNRKVNDGPVSGGAEVETVGGSTGPMLHFPVPSSWPTCSSWWRGKGGACAIAVSDAAGALAAIATAWTLICRWNDVRARR